MAMRKAVTGGHFLLSVTGCDGRKLAVLSISSRSLVPMDVWESHGQKGADSCHYADQREELVSVV